MSELGDAIDFLPPGESSCDPCVKEIDTVAFALERVRTYLFWIEEHRTSFEAIHATDPESANKELLYLANVTHQAQRHLDRLTELLMNGVTFDSTKRLPQGLIKTEHRLQKKSWNQETP